jgi:hypothetical protein
VNNNNVNDNNHLTINIQLSLHTTAKVDVKSDIGDGALPADGDYVPYAGGGGDKGAQVQTSKAPGSVDVEMASLV